MTTASAATILGVPGEKPYVLRLPPDLKARLETLAKKKDRSLNAQIVRWLNWLATQAEAGKDPAP